MTVELEDNVARNLKAAAQLVDMLQGNQETRKPFLSLIKQANPKFSIPELDAAKPVEDKIDQLQKSFEDFKVSLNQKDADQELQATRARLKADYGYTEEGIKELEKFMIDSNTADHLVAHDALTARRPKPNPMRPSFNTRVMIDEQDKDDGEWLNNPERKLEVELGKAFDAISAGAW